MSWEPSKEVWLEHLIFIPLSGRVEPEAELFQVGG
eukprot:CAMPEP_0184310840 /NCGR_PEP_ID=MMETSP1049-20130417/35067_1 /TAXON_ID=77928 /ORGANISM="Proteomonas sulcata, Strain CCMP704" /LENGTH=34 /DNA_ID= /DNA_START= /DNA_END= /DNA_ORIENTATION=